MTKKALTLATAAALAALLVFPLAAQAQQNRHRRPRCHDLRAIARFLQLSEQQVEQARAIYQEFRETVEPLREQIPPLREELSTLLEGENPAAAEVGQIVVDIDALHDQVEDAKEAADAEFEALLTEEQLARWQEFQDVCRPGYDH
jgi:Spy/CpxP family protein refolding chaperone